MWFNTSLSNLQKLKWSGYERLIYSCLIGLFHDHHKRITTVEIPLENAGIHECIDLLL